jgi:hypothetical protein
MKHVILAAGALLVFVNTPYANITLMGSTTGWNPIQYPGTTSDFYSDEQATSVEADLIGNATYSAIYTNYYDGGTASSINNIDGELGFRARLAGEQSPAGFSDFLWLGLVLDGVGDTLGTDVDIFVGYNSAANTIGVYSPGTGDNISPNTTSIESANEKTSAPGEFWNIDATILNYNWSEVTAIDTLPPGDENLDGGTAGGRNNTDHLLTIIVPISFLNEAISDLIGVPFTDETAFSIIAATSKNVNVLNQDLNGVDGGVSSTTSWEDLEAISPLMLADGTAIPEPTTTALILGLSAMAILGVRKRHR